MKKLFAALALAASLFMARPAESATFYYDFTNPDTSVFCQVPWQGIYLDHCNPIYAGGPISNGGITANVGCAWSWLPNNNSNICGLDGIDWYGQCGATRKNEPYQPMAAWLCSEVGANCPNPVALGPDGWYFNPPIKYAKIVYSSAVEWPITYCNGATFPAAGPLDLPNPRLTLEIQNQGVKGSASFSKVNDTCPDDPAHLFCQTHELEVFSTVACPQLRFAINNGPFILHSITVSTLQCPNPPCDFPADATDVSWGKLKTIYR